MITFRHIGDFSKTYKFLDRLKEIIRLSDFDKYGKIGVEALKAATPVDTGKTAASWEYGIEHKRDKTILYWSNSNVKGGTPIAVILQYGHTTGWGTYVRGRDYINPAMRPVFDKIAEDSWKEVTSKL